VWCAEEISACGELLGQFDNDVHQYFRRFALASFLEENNTCSTIVFSNCLRSGGHRIEISVKLAISPNLKNLQLHALLNKYW
jgi:hypothetical protein